MLLQQVLYKPKLEEKVPCPWSGQFEPERQIFRLFRIFALAERMNYPEMETFCKINQKQIINQYLLRYVLLTVFRTFLVFSSLAKLPSQHSTIQKTIYSTTWLASFFAPSDLNRNNWLVVITMVHVLAFLGKGDL